LSYLQGTASVVPFFSKQTDGSAACSSSTGLPDRGFTLIRSNGLSLWDLGAARYILAVRFLIQL
jgi:hypothetical protein